MGDKVGKLRCFTTRRGNERSLAAYDIELKTEQQPRTDGGRGALCDGAPAVGDAVDRAV